jgi:hypothetical protein
MLSQRLRGTFVLATLALTSYLACLDHHLFSALVILMIFVMLVSWSNTPGCHFPVHRVMRKKPLIYYILIFEYLRLLVCLIQNTNWSFFAYVAIKFSCTVKAIQCDTYVSLTTHSLGPSSCPKVPSCGCRAPTCPTK